jgi:hypothetical protein
VAGEAIRLIVADKTGARRGTIGSYRECRVVPRWNAGGTLEVTLDADHPRVPDLTTPGSRLIAQHRTSPDAPWRHLVSGNVTSRGRSGGRGRSVLPFSILSDYDRVLGALLGWVNPAGGTADGWVEGQGDEEAYWRASGSAERVALQLIAANAHRSSVPITAVVPNPGRGPQTRVDVRNKTLQEALAGVLALGVGLQVVPAATGPGLVVSGYMGRDIPQPMTEASGVVNDGSFSISAPTATRVLVAGPGEGTARLFRLVVDEAREAEWGYSIEVYRDARDLKSDAPDGEPPTRSPALAAAMDARGMETLAEGAAKASASASLTESAAFRYGVGYELGDTVTVVLDGAPPITERITEVELVHKPKEGLTVTPRVGERRDDPTTAAIRMAIAAQRGVRDLQAGR